MVQTEFNQSSLLRPFLKQVDQSSLLRPFLKQVELV